MRRLAVVVAALAFVAGCSVPGAGGVLNEHHGPPTTVPVMDPAQHDDSMIVPAVCSMVDPPAGLLDGITCPTTTTTAP